ncbi:hypothetical protein BDE36_2393 [Arcticibacter tournemirensis]|uniref:Uncharacterized protein n=1 Tax=Arcticibacter tournemirensis TaxID=699437 RepID=A0A4Q0MCG3_9SPHI|nr:hypothetical protein [Arcticibacter tournemirensis]KAA8480042.1 hypothetical protein F1649_15560 [Arcticibacter tournemirensis]RXF70486.1 hypothetical protein EKH83_07525 [Arcticibacter tournemirensis]TQM50644.1 hypothetical protein BDE36_2393 [Arcticibacter tournemirensis]
MAIDFIKERQFEMKLMEIYRQHSWLSDEIAEADFINLFPVTYKKGKIVRLEKPAGYDLNRDIYLEVLVAFRNTFT